MKLFNRAQVIREGDSQLSLDENLAVALGITNGPSLHDNVLLHGMALRPTEASSQPVLSIILSPFPVSSWPRLIRCSITSDGFPGGLHEVLEALNDLHLYCRHMEAARGLDLSQVHIHNSSIQDLIGVAHGGFKTHSIVPAAFLTLEVGTPLEGDKEAENRLRSALAQLADPADQGRPKISEAKQLEAELKKRTSPNFNIQVDWISPMSTLNRMGRLENFERLDEEKVDRQIARKTARRKFPVHRDEQGKCTIDLHPWSELLWRHRNLPPDNIRLKDPEWSMAISQVDSDEKILFCELYTQRDSADLLVAFEVIIPAHGFENHWLQWIFERIDVAEGNVLVATTSSRIGGFWSSLRIVAAFPFKPDVTRGSGDVARLLRCFRELQGTRSDHSEKRHTHMPAFAEFLRDLEKKRGNSKQRLEGWLDGIDARKEEETERRATLDLAGEKPSDIDPAQLDWRSYSTLLVRKVWDPTLGMEIEKYRSRFESNPFSFTKPLTKAGYNDLYRLTDDEVRDLQELPRSRLADHIADQAFDGENIAIVGAHRAGKTTILNLVEARLNEGKKNDGKNEVVAIPVRIHAATTPPYNILPVIQGGIKSWLEKRENAAKITALVRKGTAGILEKVTTLVDAMNVNVKSLSAVGFLKVELDNGETFDPFDDDNRKLKILQASLDQVRELLSQIEALDVGGKIIVVAMIDEVGDLASWGKEEFLQAWRLSIESREYHGVRWVISTSRPIREVSALSPITNVFKEYNVGSLPNRECNAMLDAFMDMDVARFVHEEVTGMRPLLTFRARGFIKQVTSGLPYFMQVLLYHLYERALHDEPPLLNRKTCIKVLHQFVIPEISDYLESQWRDIPPDIKSHLYGLLERHKDVDLFLKSLPEGELGEEKLSASALKTLRRAGLKGDDQLVVTPVVAAWIITTGAHSGDGD